VHGNLPLDNQPQAIGMGAARQDDLTCCIAMNMQLATQPISIAWAEIQSWRQRRSRYQVFQLQANDAMRLSRTQSPIAYQVAGERNQTHPSALISLNVSCHCC
jgi:hypothetical protein